MKTIEITTAGITLALIMACYFLFKGTFNILNALLVPLFLYGCMSRQGKKAALATIIAFLILTLLVNMLQLIFSLFYILSSLLLRYVTRRKISLAFTAVLMTAAVFLGFLFSIKMTDLIFLTRIEVFILNLVQGSYTAYLAVIALEALLVGTALAFAARFFDRRIQPLSSVDFPKI